MAEKKGFYITTAIAYPNNRMHVGFAWEVIGSDMVARLQRMRGKDVFFSTGLDEHSQNVEKAAKEKGLEPKAYCDLMAADIRAIMESMDISYNRFIRTSDTDHKVVAAHLMERAIKAGVVYKKEYQGLYCESCEVFYTEKDLVAATGGSDKLCPTHKTPVKNVSEENYFFKLSQFHDYIRQWLAKENKKLRPNYRAEEIRQFINQELHDFSVSRTSFKYGIKVPGEDRHIIYVWYDALINYLTAVKYPCAGNSNGDEKFFSTYWPADVHVIGKDITRFHTVYWPAMLKATELDGGTKVQSPRMVWAHGFINLNGEKMSKTRGNIVTPDAVIADYGVNALRWYLLAANAFDGDGNYNDQDLIAKYNADLANNIGNLVNRTVNMSLKYFPGQSPKRAKELFALPDGAVHVQDRANTALGVDGSSLLSAIDGGSSEGEEGMAIHSYCARVQEFAFSLNKYIDVVKPWGLAKDESRRADLETALYELLEGIRILAHALYPVVPAAAVAILKQIGRETDLQKYEVQRYIENSSQELAMPMWQGVKYSTASVFALKEPTPLFPRIDSTASTTK